MIGTEEAEHGGSGFIPMGLFNPNGMSGWNNEQANQELEALPPGIQLTEEELDQRLRESFNSGLQEGKNLAERGLINVFKALRTASELIHDMRERVLKESEDELINLIMMVARKVIAQEIAQDRCILGNLIQSALANLSEREEVTVRLNPDDYALITSGQQECLLKEMHDQRLRLKADPTIELGGCQIDADMGTIDASISAQLDEVYRRLLEQRTIDETNTAES